MREPLDTDEFIHFASKPGATALYVKEAMGLTYSTSYISRLIKRYVGARPTQKSVERRNVLRDVVVQYMETRGLDKLYCYECGRRSGSYPCAIHPLVREPSLDDLVFVCVRCAAPGDS